eukprot:jgi/Ulvmu1/6829/UM031_0033.1
MIACQPGLGHRPSYLYCATCTAQLPSVYSVLSLSLGMGVRAQPICKLLVTRQGWFDTDITDPENTLTGDPIYSLLWSKGEHCRTHAELGGALPHTYMQFVPGDRLAGLHLLGSM